MISLEPQEKGAKAYSTLKSYTKDELIEEIRILEHNLASVEEFYERGVIQISNVFNHFPDAPKWSMEFFNADNGNWRMLTQSITVEDDCYKIHNGKACQYCQAECSKRLRNE